MKPGLPPDSDRPLTGRSPYDTVLPLLHILPCGPRLRMFRMAKGWTQAELAKAAGLNVDYVSELERGVKQGGARGWKRLADALEVSVLDFMSEQERAV